LRERFARVHTILQRAIHQIIEGMLQRFANLTWKTGVKKKSTNTLRDFGVLGIKW
jgi:hypothetical protein